MNIKFSNYLYEKPAMFMIFWAFLIGCPPGFGQAFLVEPGQFSHWGNVSYENTQVENGGYGDHSNSYGLAVGYTAYGVFDLYASTNYTSEAVERSTATAKSFGGIISFVPTNFEGTSVAGLELAAGYGFTSLGGAVFKNVDASAKTILIGAGLFKKFRFGDKFSLIPKFEIQRNFINVTIQNNGEEYKDDESANIYQLLTSFLFNSTQNYSIIVSPNFSFNESAYSIGITLGVSKIFEK